MITVVNLFCTGWSEHDKWAIVSAVMDDARTPSTGKNVLMF